MLSYWKKKYSILGTMALCLSLSASIWADDQNDIISSYGTSGRQDCSVETCEPSCEPCGEFIVSAEFLYWRALQNGLVCNCGTDIKNKWNPGFRLGVEYGTSFTDWSVIGLYTHMYNDSHHHKGSSSSTGSGNHVKWQLYYDAIDLLYTHEFFSSACFNYTPYIGLRAVRIDQKLKAHFEECNCGPSGSSYSSFGSSSRSGSVFHQNHKQKLYGIGPEIGMNVLWDLGCNFSLYGNLGAGILYGNFKLHVRDFEDVTDPTDDGSFCLNRNINACQAFGDVGIGVLWETTFCNDREVMVGLGLEHHRYFNQNQIGGYGDLCLDGVVLSFGFKF